MHLESSSASETSSISRLNRIMEAASSGVIRVDVDRAALWLGCNRRKCCRKFELSSEDSSAVRFAVLYLNRDPPVSPVPDVSLID